MISPAMKEILQRSRAAMAPPDLDSLPVVMDRTSALAALLHGQLASDPAVKDRIMARIEGWLVDQNQAAPG